MTIALENVVIVTDSLSVDGGSAKVALGSAIALADAGLQVVVFAAAGKPAEELRCHANIRIVSTAQGTAIASHSRVRGALQGLWNHAAGQRMSEVLASLDRTKTVVHIHGWTKALSSSVIGSVVRANFPIVLTLHEYFSVCPTGCLYLHRDRKVCTLKPMSLECVLKDCDSRNYAVKAYRVVRQLIQQTIGAIPRGIRSYITVSDFSRRILEPYLPARSRYFAIDNPVDAIRSSRVEVERNSSIVFVGRLSAEKGAAFLAEAARKAGVHVTFIGDGPNRKELEHQYPEAIFTGWLEAEQVSARMRSARCIVVPSLWYETLGLVVLEAAALGLPAIVPRGTAASDLVQNGVTGLMFERGDADDLAVQLRACASDDLIASLSRSAYAKFWSEPRTLRLHVAKLLTTYESVLHPS